MAAVLLIVGASLAASRLQTSGSGLLLDGKPWNMRAVTYAPTPIGSDPTSFSSGVNFFSSEYDAVHELDIGLLAEMGANSVRLYELYGSTDSFMKRIAAANLTVMGGFGLYVDTGLSLIHI